MTLSPQSQEGTSRTQPNAAGTPTACATLNVPNVITVARLVITPIILWSLINGHARSAFLLFVLAGISDAVDGYLAKRFNQRTQFGAYLDPVADKLLIAGIFISLGWIGELPAWLVFAVVARDVMIVAGVVISAVLARPVRIQPLRVSKLNTALQILLAAVVLADNAFMLGLGPLRDVLVWVTVLFTGLSLVAYARHWLEHMFTGVSA